MSKEKREKERAAWRELKIVIHNYRALGFDYLIRRPSQQNVCFGSTIEREACTLEYCKMNSFMRRIASGPPVNIPKTSSKKRTQDCTFYHRHGGTTASVKLLPKREMIKRFRWEHYLSQFSL
ncbi:uncharacterized protein LOC119072017 [Bradysia coprophila]|uniref:uncharacterized protein LOC119072017 n=1 Tax=Bradysia coprophila TaxID=38358 RepID=UPI00187D740D|nr:uncharacterized protein LOC119072017 [Bradysia coprophila]